MRPDLFKHLISFDEARVRVLAAAMPIDRVETVALADADGRVVAADVLAPVDVPAFDRSAMDGYAVRSADVAQAAAERPVALRCVGHAFTGTVPERSLGAGECIAIGTGAPLPAGADAVVIVEHTERSGDDVRVRSRVTAGQNIGRRGADMARGSLVLRAGDPLGPARIGSLAAIGRTAVDVFERPSIAILSTGNEITPPGEPLRPGHVYDVNRFTIDAVARRHGAVTTLMPSAGDTRAELLAALERAAAHDVIVFSGGSSVGERDLVVQALEGRAEILFHGIAIKPGKPTLLARVGRAVFFGMPGNPTSCLTNAYLLLVPLVRRIARLPAWEPMTITAPLARAIRSSADRHQFYSVRIVDGRVEPAFKSSGDITSLASAHGFIEIPASAGGLEAGEIVTVTLL